METKELIMADETYNEIQNLIINTFNEYKDLLKRNRNGEPFLFPLNTSAIPEWERVLRNRGLRNELFDGLSPEGYKYIIDQCVELADIYNLSTKNRLMRMRIKDVNAIPWPEPGFSELLDAAASGEWPAGQVLRGWLNNGDGTFTAQAGATLSVLFGRRWEEISDFRGRPENLKIGETVGLKNNMINQPIITAPVNTSNQWINPVNGPITSPYGIRQDPNIPVEQQFHTGIDIAVPTGTPILAAASGTVVIGDHPSVFGYFVVLNPESTELNPSGQYRIITNHMSKRNVQNGQRVEAGSIIGLSGGTKGGVGAGNSTGPHVCIMVRTDGKNTPVMARGNTINPTIFFKF
jgi:murein DD-endopeptidase MepM/ murein hydrolase activator NlpD